MGETEADALAEAYKAEKEAVPLEGKADEKAADVCHDRCYACHVCC